jgi:hypothetical protein
MLRAGGRRKSLFEELHPLSAELDAKPGKAGDVTTGMRKARSKAGCHGIGAGGRRDDRDRSRGLLRDLRGSLAIGDDEVDRQPDQIGRHRRQSAIIPGSEPILDGDVRAVDVAELAQSVTEGVERRGRW